MSAEALRQALVSDGYVHSAAAGTRALLGPETFAD